MLCVFCCDTKPISRSGDICVSAFLHKTPVKARISVSFLTHRKNLFCKRKLFFTCFSPVFVSWSFCCVPRLFIGYSRCGSRVDGDRFSGEGSGGGGARTKHVLCLCSVCLPDSEANKRRCDCEKRARATKTTSRYYVNPERCGYALSHTHAHADKRFTNMCLRILR